jgi:predicted small lipoprotein YifL
MKIFSLLIMVLILLSGPIGCGHKGPPTPPKSAPDSSSKNY